MRAPSEGQRVSHLLIQQRAKNIPSDVAVMQQAHVTQAAEAGSALHMKSRWPPSTATSRRISSLWAYELRYEKGRFC